MISRRWPIILHKGFSFLGSRVQGEGTDCRSCPRILTDGSPSVVQRDRETFSKSVLCFQFCLTNSSGLFAFFHKVVFIFVFIYLRGDRMKGMRQSAPISQELNPGFLQMRQRHNNLSRHLVPPGQCDSRKLD